jgi:FkbM family methyltransferase
MLKYWKTRLPLFPVWPETADLEGILVPIRDSPFPAFLRRHLLGGGYEVAERLLVREFVETGDQVLEIGASLGIVSSFLWRQVGEVGRVVSVEGNPNLRNGFDRQMKLNGFRGEWVGAVCWPTWEEHPPSETRQSGLLPQSNPLGSAVVPGSTAGAETSWKTARQVCLETGLEPTVVIVDIEGSETVWIESPPRLPDHVRVVIVEFHPTLVSPVTAGKSVQALIDEGFRIQGMSGTVLAFVREQAAIRDREGILPGLRSNPSDSGEAV